MLLFFPFTDRLHLQLIEKATSFYLLSKHLGLDVESHYITL